MWTNHPFFGFRPIMLFQAGTAYDAAARAFAVRPTELPHIPRYVPRRPTERVTPPAPVKSRPLIIKSHARVTGRSHRCAGKGCDNQVGPRARLCDKCRQRKCRANKKAKVAR